MAKQSLFYEEVVPITKERHMGWSVEKPGNFSFAATQHSVPLMFSEFHMAAQDLPIVFGKSGDSTTPLAVMGLQADTSLLIDGDGAFTGRYIPAFLRRYPFIFARGAGEGDTLALCLDETHSGVDQSGERGEKLFDEAGEPSAFLNQTMEFAKTFEVDLRKTAGFTKLLEEKNLLDPMQASITLANGQKIALTGFFVVSRERLKALDADVVQDMFQRDILELIYYHLQSLKNMERLRDLVT